MCTNRRANTARSKLAACGGCPAPPATWLHTQNRTKKKKQETRQTTEFLQPVQWVMAGWRQLLVLAAALGAAQAGLLRPAVAPRG